MNNITNEFVYRLSDFLDKRELSENDYYFTSQLISVLDGSSSNDIKTISLVSFTKFLDAFNYHGYARGYLIFKIMLNNLRIVDSEAYTVINIREYSRIYQSRGIDISKFINDVRELRSYCLEGAHPLTSYQQEIFQMLYSEEKKRLLRVKMAKHILDVYHNLSVENMDEILAFLTSEGLSLSDVEDVRVYLNVLIAKHKKNEVLIEPFGVKSCKLGYTKSDIKAMKSSLDKALSYVHSGGLINVDDYLKHLKEVLVLKEVSQASDVNIDELFSSLNINADAYDFLVNKARFLLDTNKAIDIRNILSDIEYLNDILKCEVKEKSDFEQLLNEMYVHLHNVILYDHRYESGLVL